MTVELVRPLTSITPDPVTIPLYLVGEMARLLVMTATGTRAVDAEVTAVSYDRDDLPHVTFAFTGERSTFALVPAAEDPDEPDPIATPCAGCNAAPGEPCRWRCLSHITGCGHSPTCPQN